MLGTIRVDAANQLIRLEFDQHATMEDWKEAQVLVLPLSNETGIRRVLVDVRKQEGIKQMGKLFEFGAGIPNAMAFAVLSEPNRADHRFVETVALNRGKNVRLFHGSEADAIEWLKKWRYESTDGRR